VRRPPFFLIAVAVAAMTAGCTGLGGPFAGDDATETLTPVSVQSSPESGPTQSATPTGRADDDSALEPAALVTAHTRALRDEPFRLRITQRVLVNGSTIRNSTYSRRMAADHERFRATFSREPDGYTPNTTLSAVETYYNGSVLATRYRTSEGAQPQYTYARNVSSWAVGVEPRLERLLYAFRGEYWKQTDRASATVIWATQLSDPTALSVPPGTTDPRDGEILVETSGDGVIRTVRVEYAVTVGQNRTGRVVRTIRFFDADRTGVKAPDWIKAGAAN
jgi:hypothetical protein